MADAKVASSPSVSGDGSPARTAPADTMEGTATTIVAVGGGDVSSESGETAEAKALAQGPCGPLTSFLLLLLI
jgi:hypothetical protein